jgi:hypothetical protein
MGTVAIDPTTNHLIISGYNGNGMPTVAAGTAAGGSPPAPVVGASSNDSTGWCTFGTGNPFVGAGPIVTVAFHSVGSCDNPPNILLTPFNAQTLDDMGYLCGVPQGTSGAWTGFNVHILASPAANKANTFYGFSWLVAF